LASGPLVDSRDRPSLDAFDIALIWLLDKFVARVSAKLTKASEKSFQQLARLRDSRSMQFQKAGRQTIPSVGSCHRISQRTILAAMVDG
jgi:hypothetical protein